MERGGGALRSHVRPHPATTCWALLASRSPPLLRPSRGGSDGARSRRLAPPSGKPRLAHHFRSCIHLKDREYLIIHKALQKSHTAQRVFSLCEPQEASLCNEELRRNKLLIDCETDQECVVGGIVALGKFDALHIGHRELAIQASKAGVPFLLSFVGMAEVLGWETRAPIVAKCDRKRVLSSWAPCCGNVVPVEFQVEFSSVRHLTPRQFVERLSMELRVSGVVAGENYRFGYRASGDAFELVRLCKEYGLDAFIVSPVMDSTGRSYNGATKGINLKDRGQVSSTRVRQALAIGDMEYVAELLGRKHRLMLMADETCICSHNRILIPKPSMLNQPPGDGVYSCTLLVDDALVGPCRVVIDAEKIDIELDDASVGIEVPLRDGQLVGIEFNNLLA